MSKRQSLITSYFLSRSLFLGVGFSLLISKTNKDTWISAILGILLGIVIVYCYSKIADYKKGKSLKELLKEMGFWGYVIRLILLLFSLFLLHEAIVIFQLFASSFFLIFSPEWFIVLPVIYLIFLISKKEYQSLGRISECLIPITLFLLGVTLVVLTGYIKIDNFTPIFTAEPTSILENTLCFALLSSIPMFYLIDMNKEDGKGYIKMYLFNSLSLLLMLVIIIGVLGPVLLKSYRFPEYMVLKKVRLFNFIEKIENIASIPLILDTLILVFTSSINIKRMLPKVGKKYTFPLLILGIYILCSFYLANNYQYILSLYYLLPYILLGVFLIVVLPLFFYSFFKRKKR